MIDRRLCVVGLALVVCGSSGGQPANETLTGWPMYLEVPLLDGKAPGLYDLLATPAMYTHSARADLLDLRLYNASGREVPIAIRHRSPQSEFRAFAPREFNRVSDPDGSAAVSLDLGAEVVEHNRIEVTTGGTDFRRAVKVEGGDDGMAWQALASGELRYFAGGGQVFDQRAITYAASRFRYVRVTVAPDKGNKDDRPGAVQARVVRESRDPGIEVTWPAALSQREPGRAAEGYTSQWTISLESGERVPWEVLEFDADDREFSRSYRIEEMTADEPWPLLASGQWERGPNQKGPLRVRLSQRTIAAKLRLVVIDQRNPPLQLRLVSAKASADQILFQRTEDLTGPLRLYLGNPSAIDPGYDIGRTLPEVPAPTQRLTVGSLHQNPDYRPPPDTRTLLDRLPWATAVVFGTVVALLAGLLGATARHAIRRHDTSKDGQY